MKEAKLKGHLIPNEKVGLEILAMANLSHQDVKQGQISLRSEILYPIDHQRDFHLGALREITSNEPQVFEEMALVNDQLELDKNYAIEVLLNGKLKTRIRVNVNWDEVLKQFSTIDLHIYFLSAEDWYDIALYAYFVLADADIRPIGKGKILPAICSKYTLA